jgi:hypothetical protein
MTELYKYRTFNEQTLEALVQDVIWVSKRDAFNDPLEGAFHINPDMSFYETKRRRADATEENYKTLQSELIDQLKHDFITGGVYCLSERRDISLMWSHYAESHNGFCIGYEVTDENDLRDEICHKVVYGDYPKIGLSEIFKGVEKGVDHFKIVFDTFILSKDPNWAYEKERRILYQNIENKLIRHNFKMSSITFGLRTSGVRKHILYELLKDKDIEFFETYINNEKYDLGVRKIDITSESA